VVLSHDGFNENDSWRSIIVIPITTSTAHARRGPTVIALPERGAGLPKSSFAVCHQVTTLDRSKLTKRIGSLPLENLRDVEDGLRAALDLE
jgi:mRNA interferase MazF